MNKFLLYTLFLSGLMVSAHSHAQQKQLYRPPQSIQPLDHAQIPSKIDNYDFARYSTVTDTFDLSLSGDFTFLDDNASEEGGLIYQRRYQSVLGNEFIIGKKIAPMLSVHLNLFENEDVGSALMQPDFFSNSSGANGLGYSSMDADLLGFQLGISSVLNLTGKTQFGFEFEHGRIETDYPSLLGEDITATSFGLGLRTGRFGASLNSDLFTSQNADMLDRTTLDFQFDWHFTDKGTISFGAHKNMSDSSSSEQRSIDDFTGTIPYIKFRHNL
ncbi:hypothetical protein [Marinicella sp. W31]|uniref:hypothetical protein n=1 Tax=Marinicella sp. W31 TaxID=3023713 RepID=UPI00375839A3